MAKGAFALASPSSLEGDLERTIMVTFQDSTSPGDGIRLPVFLQVTFWLTSMVIWLNEDEARGPQGDMDPNIRQGLPIQSLVLKIDDIGDTSSRQICHVLKHRSADGEFASSEVNGMDYEVLK